MIDLRKTPLGQLVFMSVLMGGASLVEDTATGNPVTFETDVAKPLVSLEIPFAPQQEGTGDPSPQNIRSIVPWEGLKVWNGDVNWNQLIAKNAIASKSANGIIGVNNGDGSYTVSGTASALFDAYTEFQMQANHVYYVTGAPEGAENDTYQLYFNSKKILANGLLTKYTSTQFKSYDIIVRSGTALSGSKVFYPQLFDLTLMFGETFANALYNAEEQTAGSGISQIREILPKKYYEYKAPDENQHSYSLTETDISFPSPVYGGTPDIISGRMLVEWALISQAWKDWRFGADLGTNSRKTTDLIPYGLNGANNSICNVSNYYFNNNGTDVAHWYISTTGKTAYAVLPNDMDEDTVVEIAYKLAEPFEIQLTPQQITALKGDNTIWSDADGSMTAVYLKKA